MKILVAKDDRFQLHLKGIPHLESPKRFIAASTTLEDPIFNGMLQFVPAREASLEELSLVHTPEYISRIGESRFRPMTTFDLDTQGSEQTFDVARLAVGTILNLMDGIWLGQAKRGLALVRPPGHHAEPSRAMGFCIFNNIALAARYLLRRHRVKRLMIVDVDLHHGNGTQRVFYDSDEVLFVSWHVQPGFPGTGGLGEIGQGAGEGFTVNVPLKPGYGDKDFARITYFLLNSLAQEYRPEMLLVSCGFDLYFKDPLGAMKVTPHGYALITSFLLDLAERFCQGRVAFILEGGYSLNGIRECLMRVAMEMCDIPTLTTRQIDDVRNLNGWPIACVKKVHEIHRCYWRSLAG